MFRSCHRMGADRSAAALPMLQGSPSGIDGRGSGDLGPPALTLLRAPGHWLTEAGHLIAASLGAGVLGLPNALVWLAGPSCCAGVLFGECPWVTQVTLLSAWARIVDQGDGRRGRVRSLCGCLRPGLGPSQRPKTTEHRYQLPVRTPPRSYQPSRCGAAGC